MKPSAVCISILFALLPFSSAKLAIKTGKASVAGSDGSIDTTSAIDTSKGSQSLKLNAQDTLKLSFTVYDDADNVDVQPHQTFLRFWDASTEEEGIVPVKVSRDGKAKFTMNLRKPPVGLPPSSTNPLQVTLLLGSFTRESAAYPLFDLTLPPSGKVPPHPEEETFHPQPEIAHTFRPEQKSPLKFISLVFAIATLSPWVVLLGLLSQLPISVKPTSRTLPFLALLAAFEGLLLWYWVGLYLGQVLSYGAVLGVLTAVAGKRALSAQK